VAAFLGSGGFSGFSGSYPEDHWSTRWANVKIWGFEYGKTKGTLWNSMDKMGP